MHERRLAKEVGAELNFGSVQLTYSNNALFNVSELLAEGKSLPYFRDVTLIPDCLLPKGRKNLLTPEGAREDRERKKELDGIKETLSEMREQRALGNQTMATKKARHVNSLI